MTEFVVIGVGLVILATLLKSRWNYHRFLKLPNGEERKRQVITPLLEQECETQFDRILLPCARALHFCSPGTRILLLCWLPVLIWGLHDMPPGMDVREMLFTPVMLLAVAPFIGLWPWYRSWRVAMAVLAIYVLGTRLLNEHNASPPLRMFD